MPLAYLLPAFLLLYYNLQLWCTNGNSLYVSDGFPFLCLCTYYSLCVEYSSLSWIYEKSPTLPLGLLSCHPCLQPHCFFFFFFTTHSFVSLYSLPL